MSVFVQLLESRKLLSASPVSKTQLISDQQLVISDGQAAIVADKDLVATLAVDNKAVATDLKSLPKTNAPLAAALRADLATTERQLAAELSLLVKPSTSLSSKAVVRAEGLINLATVKSLATETAYITQLDSITTTPLSNLQAVSAATVVSDYNNILAANPTATQLNTDITAAMHDLSSGQTALNTAASTFSGAIAATAADLNTVVTAVGTFPALTGTFNGTATPTNGKNAHQPQSFTIIISHQDSLGNLTGTVTDLDETTATDPISGSVTLNGKLKFTAVTTLGTKITITGVASGGTISGSYKAGSKVHGVISLTVVPAVYDASNDYAAGFNAATNPNGVWSYGWTPSLTGALTLYGSTGALPYGNSFDTWYDTNFGLHSPFVYQNEGAAYSDANVSIPAGALILHGGSQTAQTNFSNVVFTAPAAGSYSVNATFTGRQVGGELASVNVLDNGTSLFSSSVINGQAQNYSSTLNLAAGETITFAVGYVNQTPVDGDSVQFEATLTAT